MLRGALRWVLAACVGLAVPSCSLLVDDEGLSDGKCPAASCVGEDGRQRCVPSISPNYGCACPAGQKWCTPDLEDRCVSTDDPKFGCARPRACAPCYFKNGAATCDADGECAFSTCTPGYADCDESADHSCETNLTASAQHCNECGRDCLEVVALRTGGQDQVDSAACVEGQCVVTRCSDGWGDCNKLFSDGCEIDFLTRNDHCGACGRPCAGGTACSNGVCE